MNVLFVCIQNAGRSQIASALFDRAAAGAPAARSAGSNPAEHMHPEVVEAMRELEIDVSDRVPRKLDRADAEWADLVVTMGCGDACPYIPGKRYIDWQVDDPHGQPPERSLGDLSLGERGRLPRRGRRCARVGSGDP